MSRNRGGISDGEIHQVKAALEGGKSAEQVADQFNVQLSVIESFDKWFKDKKPVPPPMSEKMKKGTPGKDD